MMTHVLIFVLAQVDETHGLLRMSKTQDILNANLPLAQHVTDPPGIVHCVEMRQKPGVQHKLKKKKQLRAEQVPYS